MIDPDNLVVKLCVAGMQAESAGRLDDAHTLFMQAWHARQNAGDACIAAHYVARHQPTNAQALHWNQVALDHARAVQDDSLQSFYPSLYLNIGRYHEILGDERQAHLAYQSALAHIATLPADPYRDLVQQGIQAGLERTTPPAK